MRFAYADPPYVGQARKHYSHDPKCAEVDMASLIATLDREYDGWALSMSATMRSLKTIIPAAPDDARLGAWAKPFASFKRGVDPAFTWEPVLYKTRRKWNREQPTCKDHVIEADCVVENITLKRGLAGVKPERFCLWLFDLLGMTPDDQFFDLFPGSRAVQRAWETWVGLPGLDRLAEFDGLWEAEVARSADLAKTPAGTVPTPADPGSHEDEAARKPAGSDEVGP